MGRINYERQPRGLKNVSLERMQRLAALLGNPQDRLPVIHVAGTKGKGSTCCMLAEIYRRAGWRVGLLTSPHLQRIEERISVDGEPISADCLTQLVEEIRPRVEHLDRASPTQRGPTFFDILTAAGFLHFARVPVDLAVIEVGLGGRLDSTNVCRPRCTAITTISRDHMKQLGDSEALIAREKAGIIKDHIPVVCGVTHPEALAVIRAAAAEHAAPFVELQRDFFVELHPGRASLATAAQTTDAPPRGPVFDYRFLDTAGQSHILPHIQVAMLGDHQAQNAALAIAIVKLLDSQVAVDETAIRAGLATTQVAARIELLGHAPLVIVDGGHNEASIQALCDTLDQNWPEHRKTFVFGTTRGKDIRAMLRRLLQSADDVTFTRYVENPRGAEPAALAQLAETLVRKPCRLRVVACPAQAWRQTLQQAAADDLICVTGSLYLAAELRERMVADLRRQPERGC
jgi:dihydrofolate synthase/folylpolyglutamate synthase